MAAPPAFPLYMQCDARWGADEMGVVGDGERSTICGEGCAMSCLAMVLKGVGVPVFGTLPATPQTLNAWLLTNAGYTCIDGDCNDLVLDAVQRLDPRVRLVGYLAVPPFAELAAGVAAGALAYIARIVPDDPRFESHFILLTGLSPTAPAANFTVLDPYYPKASPETKTAQNAPHRINTHQNTLTRVNVAVPLTPRTDRVPVRRL